MIIEYTVNDGVYTVDDIDLDIVADADDYETLEEAVAIILMFAGIDEDFELALAE